MAIAEFVRQGRKDWSSVITTEGFAPETGQHEWLVHIEKSERGHIFIGIASSDCSLETYIGGDDHSWGLIGTKALWHNRTKVKASYGDGFKTGSTVHVKYDSDKGKLYYSNNNGVNWGLAFENIPPIKLFPAVSLYQREDKAFISFKCTPRPASPNIGNSSSSVSNERVSSDIFYTVTPLLQFVTSLFEYVDKILNASDVVEGNAEVGIVADTVSVKVAILSHPFISLILPMIASCIITNNTTSECASFLGVHLLPHLSLISKCLAHIHEVMERGYIVDAHDKTTSAAEKTLKTMCQKEFGLIGNISGLWRIRSEAGGSSIPAQEYYLQIVCSPYHLDSEKNENLLSDENTGKYKPLSVSGCGHGNMAKVSLNGTLVWNSPPIRRALVCNWKLSDWMLAFLWTVQVSLEHSKT